ncbi:MAG: hypothetical protein QHH30_01200 [candidate division NC10 bacterium]|nr:hypothetical protein [candidate division NC10 bacterium]
MILQRLLNEGRLRPHQTSAREIADLFQVVERDLTDASLRELSPDRRFATANNAALQLAIIALHAAGYRAAGMGHHWAILQALPEIMGPEAQGRADYLEHCRTKRNVTEYDRAGAVSEIEVEEILREARTFRADLLDWLRGHHPGLMPKGLK